MGRTLGIEDPEQWLEDCPDRVYENWQAYAAVEPFGNEKELLARIAALLTVLCMKDREIESVNNLVQVIMQSLMPANWVEQPKAKQDADPSGIKAFEQQVARKYG